MPARRAPATNPDGTPVEGGKEKLTFGCAFPGCGQTYSRMEYLKRHQRKHQDERPFQCKDCSKAFARSDVLLRHRRRCHPTPPPRDRNSHSPMPPVRAHPSVPISSSRTSEREASPIRGGASRKHARTSEGSSHDDLSATRPRLASEDEDEDRYGSRFSRNGMGNGGVFGVSNYYNGNPVSTDTNYTPHILPMFQNANGAYHNMHDPNHLEDASVLLSMAYPGGVPGQSETSPTVAGQRVIPDWAEGDAGIGGTAETTGAPSDEVTAAAVAAATAATAAAAAASTSENESPVEPTIATTASSSFNSGAVENPARPAAPGALLPESMGSFAGTINWLANGGSTQSEAVDSTAWSLSEPRPLSPLNMFTLFSPSGFTASPLPLPSTQAGSSDATLAVISNSAGSNGNDQSSKGGAVDPIQQANQVVAAILQQIALNDAPETLINPNPERPLLRLASKEGQIRAGEECPRSSRFYLPGDRFAGCYQIPHWALPPLRTLSVMAARTYHTVLSHFPFIHDPTFHLIDTAACLAFAICTVGGIRVGGRKELPAPYSSRPVSSNSTTPSISAGGAWEGISPDFSIGYDPEEEEDHRRLEEWDAGQIVRHEKTNMLVKSFSLAHGVLMTEYNVALLQALILYHAPYFLSNIESDRRHANMFLGTIVNITRQIGFFNPHLEHAEATIQIPPVIPHDPVELDRAWRRWIQLESRRRTSYLVYHIDTVAALESSIPCIVTPNELAGIPLPAPDTLWQAKTASEWLVAIQTYRPITLDEAMRREFHLPSAGRFDSIDKIADTGRPNLLSEYEYGPFARTAIVMTILRGIIDMGEGKRDHGNWSDLTDLWVVSAQLKPDSRCLTGEGRDLGPFSMLALRNRYDLALRRWREGWESDSLCQSSGSDASTELINALNGFGSAFSPAGSTPESIKPKQHKILYCEEALPFYFLAHSLLGMLVNSSVTDPSYNALSNVRFNELLDASRTLARAGGGLPIVPSTMI